MALARYDITVQDAQGRALSGADIYFCTQPANTSVFPPTPLATVYSDLNNTVLTQPVITDGFGHADAYLTIGTLYTVVISHPLFPAPQVYADQYAGADGSGTNVVSVNASTLAGTITGSGTAWVLPSVPISGSLILDKNGMVQTPGLGYTISGKNITLATALGVGEGLNANYLTGSGSIGGVSSVFGRTGDIVAVTGDYTAAQVTNAADKTATLNTFTGSIAVQGSTGVGMTSGANAGAVAWQGNSLAITASASGGTIAFGLTPVASFEAAAGVIAQSNTAEVVYGLATSIGGQTYTAYQNLETVTGDFLNSSNTVEYQVGVRKNGTPTMSFSIGDNATTLAKHLASTGTAPTVAVQTGAGTGATTSVTGTDTRGKITLNSQATGGATGAWVTLTFANAYGAAPIVVLTNGSSVVSMATSYVTSTTTTFTINSTVAPATQTVIYNYIVIG